MASRHPRSGQELCVDSEDEFDNSSCPDTEEDSEEERQHYELIIDPTDDDYSDDDDDLDNTPPVVTEQLPGGSAESDGNTPPLQVATQQPSSLPRRSCRMPRPHSPTPPAKKRRVHPQSRSTPASQASMDPPWKPVVTEQLPGGSEEESDENTPPLQVATQQPRSLPRRSCRGPRPHSPTPPAKTRGVHPRGRSTPASQASRDPPWEPETAPDVAGQGRMLPFIQLKRVSVNQLCGTSASCRRPRPHAPIPPAKKSCSTPASQASKDPPKIPETAPDVAPPDVAPQVSRFQPEQPPGVQLNSAEESTRASLQAATENHQAPTPASRPRPHSPIPPAKKRRSTPASQASRHPPWKTETAPDVAPPVSRFQPARPPGVQLNTADEYTPLDLFKLFVTKDAVNTLCKNTNKQAARAQAKGSKYKWTDVGVEEFYRYIGLLFYMAIVKLTSIQDYWRQNSIFSVTFPATVMPRDRYRSISWNVQMSDPDKDQENVKKRGTPQYDKLFRLRPFMDTIQNGCKSFFHPRRNISVGERMLMPTKSGFNLFVLCDSSNGYTVDFAVYPGKNDFTALGGHDTVIKSLVNRSYLGSGYHVYMDNFYTSPKLFRDLLALKIGACGTYRNNRKDCPRTESNALTKKSPRGSIRWIRDGPLVFVKWVDTKVVSLCSTIHAAFAGDTVQRTVKEDGALISKDFPCPSPITDYNKYRGGVDLSDQLIQYYTAQNKAMKWYRKLFLHFLDIAATNAYLLHKDLAFQGQWEAMTHKAFQEELAAQLCGVSQKMPPTRANCDHVPVPIIDTQFLSVREMATAGRQKCKFCRTNGKQMATPWKCKTCDVPLCLQLTRNCFEEWHSLETCDRGPSSWVAPL